jgi:hypothetical protein
MNRIRRYRFLATALAVCVAGATAPSVLMAQGTPSFAAYGHSHKKHHMSAEAMAKKKEAKKGMSKEEMSKKAMATKSENKWQKKEMNSKKMETKKAETHMNMMGQKPPHPGMVWVNTNSKVYHTAGSKYYGNTKHGKWMTAAEAQKAGYKASKN